MVYSGFVIVCVNANEPERLIVALTSNFIEFLENKKGFLVYCQGIVCDNDEEFKELDNQVSDVRIKMLNKMISLSNDDTIGESMFQQHFELLLKETIIDAQIVANKYTWHVPQILET